MNEMKKVIGFINSKYLDVGEGVDNLIVGNDYGDYVAVRRQGNKILIIYVSEEGKEETIAELELVER